MPFELDSGKYKILHSSAEECPVKLNLEGSVDIVNILLFTMCVSANFRINADIIFDCF